MAGPISRNYGVLGEEVNMAARLMMAAKPGQILISAAAQRSLGPNFVVEELAPIHVKGRSQAVALFALVGQQQRQGTHLSMPAYAVPMVGRAAELALVPPKLDAALAGAGQIIGVSGEPGLGKSRLVAEIIRMTAEQPFAVYGGEAESYGLNSSYLVMAPDLAWDLWH